MATELEAIIARLKANTAHMARGFEDMVRKARTSTQQIADHFKRLGRTVQNIGKKMFTAVTLPISGLTGFSIKAASDVQELMNLVAVTFGDATDSVVMWASETSDAVQRSRYDLLQAAGDFASFLKPLGVAPEQVKPMSQALAQLTTDIGSFRNMADAEVMTRLFSGMAGETEAVRRLGIDIGVAAVEAELLSLGFEGNFQTATQAQKAVARYNLIMRQTSDAQGDAIRTAGSFENQWKGFLATMRDVRVAIGNHLLPIATRLVSAARNIGIGFNNLSESGQRTILMFAGIAAAVGPGLIVLGTLIRLIGFAIGGFGMLANVGTRAIGFLGRTIATVIGGAVSAITGFIGYVGAIPAAMATAIAATIAAMLLFPATMKEIFSMEALSAILDTFQVAFYNKVVAPTKIMINDLIEAINRIPGIDIELLELPGQREISDTTKEFANNLSSTFETELNRVKGQLASAMEGVTDSVMGILPEGLRDVLSELRNFAFGDFGADIGMDQGIMDMDEFMKKYMDAFDTMGDFGSQTIQGLSEDAKDLAEDLRQAFIGRLADINSLGDAMSAVLDRLKAQLLEIAFFGTDGNGGLFGGLFNNIAGMFAGFFGGARASGGPVEAGRGYLVGEKGPELFVPGQGGRVMSNRETAAMGGAKGIVVNQNFNLPPDNAELTERMIGIGTLMRDQAIQAFRQAGNRGF